MFWRYGPLLLMMISVGLMLSACEKSFFRKGDVNSVGDQDLEKMYEYFREDFTNKKEVRFNVEYSATLGDWACVSVEPRDKLGFKAEPRWELFKKEDGAWISKDWSAGMKFKNDFEVIDLPERNSRIAKLIVQKYPDCPMQIFPPEK